MTSFAGRPSAVEYRRHPAEDFTLAPFGVVVTFTRFAVASLVLVIALIIAHLWLPAGRRTLKEIAPGVGATLILWLIAGTLFGRYLAEFAFTYSTYYAGLASPMIVLVFLYLTSSIFIYGGELNNGSAALADDLINHRFG